MYNYKTGPINQKGHFQLFSRFEYYSFKIEVKPQPCIKDFFVLFLSINPL